MRRILRWEARAGRWGRKSRWENSERKLPLSPQSMRFHRRSRSRTKEKWRKKFSHSFIFSTFASQAIFFLQAGGKKKDRKSNRQKNKTKKKRKNKTKQKCAVSSPLWASTASPQSRSDVSSSLGRSSSATGGPTTPAPCSSGPTAPTSSPLRGC